MTKVPEDFWELGLIFMLFPNARLIHCRRHPIDTCLSSYMQNFRWVRYATSLEQLAEVYQLYQRIMEHSRTVLPPSSLFDADYEDLICRPHDVMPRLLAFCGLAFEPGCLHFYENSGRVDTASRWQVRRPLYATSLNRWERIGNFSIRSCRSNGLPGKALPGAAPSQLANLPSTIKALRSMIVDLRPLSDQVDNVADRLEADRLFVSDPRFPAIFQFESQFQEVERGQSDIFDNQRVLRDMLEFRPAVGGTDRRGLQLFDDLDSRFCRHSHFPTKMQALLPPKANEFDMAVRTGCGRPTWGT